MSWFKKEVPDYDLAGQAMERQIERSPTKDEVSHSFNPDHAVKTLDGEIVVIKEAADSKEITELDDLEEIEITAQNLEHNALTPTKIVIPAHLVPKE